MTRSTAPRAGLADNSAMKHKAIDAYEHPEPTTQMPDSRPGNYYVSVCYRCRYALLAGPWPTHAEALAKVDDVRFIAQGLDPRGVWYAYGTCRLPDDGSVQICAGKLNALLGLPT